jgi:hypothetical protein
MGPQAQAAVPLFQPHHHMYAALTWITVKIQSIHQQNVRIWTNWSRLVLAMVIDLTKHYIAVEISFRAFKQQPEKIICSSSQAKTNDDETYNSKQNSSSLGLSSRRKCTTFKPTMCKSLKKHMPTPHCQPITKKEL